METSQQRFLEDPAGEEAQLVQGNWYHQEVPSWPQHLLTYPQVSASLGANHFESPWSCLIPHPPS